MWIRVYILYYTLSLVEKTVQDFIKRWDSDLSIISVLSIYQSIYLCLKIIETEGCIYKDD